MTAQATTDVNAPSTTEQIAHPSHYNSHPSGVECKEISELLPGNLSHVCVYIWRHALKGHPIRDLDKALFYLDCETKRSSLEHQEFNAIHEIIWPRLDDRLRALRKFPGDFVAKAVLALCGNPNNLPERWGLTYCAELVSRERARLIELR